jgi:hypothetical protein
MQGKWLLTYNDHPRVRELYADFEVKAVSTALNTDNGKRDESLWERRNFHQLIITNYKAT